MFPSFGYLFLQNITWALKSSPSGKICAQSGHTERELKGGNIFHLKARRKKFKWKILKILLDNRSTTFVINTYNCNLQL